MNFSTQHKLIQASSSKLEQITDSSIHLVVTSPPYPMISMWDQQFASQSPAIKNSIEQNKGLETFELMHRELDKVWDELSRVIKDGGFLCINIGDATRTLNENFCMYPNHSRISNYLIHHGFNNLPNIIWRKPTNAPNKYMGSGTYPSGAYVTLEHEHILIFRKGEKRSFSKEEEKNRRRRSSIFWAERNQWFSDLWQMKGATQSMGMKEARSRSAAYPIEIPFRLINMYSLQEEFVLDPFSGSGTTTIAAMMSGRNSLATDTESSLIQFTNKRIEKFLQNQPNEFQLKRLGRYIDQVNEAEPEYYSYWNGYYGLPVKTRQEKDLILAGILNFEIQNNHFKLDHKALNMPD
jgi:DNA modification methylase